MLSILVFVVVLVLINRPKSDDVVPDTPSDPTVVANNNVDKTKFEEAIRDLDIVSAYDCLKDKEDGSSYYNQLKSAIDAYLWKIIDESDLSLI